MQEISERNSQSAKQNKHPFKSSRKGYARIEEKMVCRINFDLCAYYIYILYSLLMF